MSEFNGYIDTDSLTGYVTRRYPNRLHFVEKNFSASSPEELKTAIINWLCMEGFAGQRIAIHYTGAAS